MKSTGKLPQGATRLRISAVAGLAALALAACSSGTSSSSTEPAAEATSGASAAASSEAAAPASDAGLFVAYIDGTCANSWRTTVRAEVEEEVKAHPEISKFEYKCAQGNVDNAVSDIESLTAQGVDIILGFNDAGAAVGPALQAARDAGVTVVPFLVNTGEGTYDAIVEDDLSAMGTSIADYFIETLGGKGNIVAITGAAGNPWDAALNDAVKKQLATSDVQFIDEAAGDWDPAKSGKAMADLLQKHPDINGVLSIEGTTVVPILDQFEAAGRPLPAVVSLDVNGVAGEMLEKMPANPSLNWGYLSARTWAARDSLLAALAIREGNPPTDPVIYIDNVMGDCRSGGCEEIHNPDMPGTWPGTSKVPVETMKALLEQ